MAIIKAGSALQGFNILLVDKVSSFLNGGFSINFKKNSLIDFDKIRSQNEFRDSKI